MREKSIDKKVLAVSATNMAYGPFIDPRAIESARRADLALRSFLLGQKIETSCMPWLMSDLIEASHHYWIDHALDHQLTFGYIKPKLQVLLPLLQQSLAALEDLPPEADCAINVEVQRDSGKRKCRSHVEETREAISALASAVQTLVAPVYAKTSRQRRFKKASKRLEKIWRRATGKRFTFTKSAKATGTQDLPEFISVPAQFVFLGLKAMDPDVTYANTNSALQDRQRCEGPPASRDERED